MYKIIFNIAIILIFTHLSTLGQSLPDMEFSRISQPIRSLPVEELGNTLNALNNNKKKAVRGCINQIKRIYSSLQYTDLKDGYYIAYIVDELNFQRCYETDVSVIGGKVDSFYDLPYKESAKIISSLPIHRNKGFITINDTYFETGLQVYFLEVPKGMEKTNISEQILSTTNLEKKDFQDVWSKAFDYYNKQQFKESINEFNYIIENNIFQLDPIGLSEVFLMRGTVKSSSNDEYGAIKDYTYGIRLNGKNSLAYNNRAWSKFILGNLKGALTDVNTAIKLDEKSSTAFDSRAEIYFNLKDYKKCIKDCNKAISINNNLTNSYFIKGRAKFRLNDKIGACENWNIAGNLGHKESLDFIVKYCQ